MEIVLVTGGSGFIGSHLIDKLVKKYHVLNYDIARPKYKNSNDYFYGDIKELKVSNWVIKNYKINTIFNLAGMLGTHELVGNAIEASKVNIIGTLNILEICKEYNIKLIEISKPNCWVNTYTITKVAAESFVEMYRKEFNIKAVIIKWFNVYGPRQPLFEEVGYTKFIPTAIIAALKNKDIVVYGNGNQTMDLVHTNDTVNATLAIVNNWEKCEGGIFDVGHHAISVNDCAELIKKLINSTSKITHIPMRRGETENTKIYADNSLLLEKTGYKMRMGLEEGLLETISWYKRKYNL